MIRKVIEIDEALCNGCGQCVPSCAEGAIEIINNKARLVADRYCDGLGACIGECPEGALKIIERDAEEFDEEAVYEYLEKKKKTDSLKDKSLPCGCPSTQLHTFHIPGHSQNVLTGGNGSALTHWPVKIRLIPASAPFLKGADILIAADCSPIASGGFHHDYLKGKVVMIGCPKFDDLNMYREKFIQIFNNVDIKSITTVSMEVPCCSGLPAIVKKALDETGKTIPLEEIVISVRGDVLKKTVENL